MPILAWLAIGALAGGGATYALSDTVKSTLKWGVVLGGGYLIYRSIKKG